MYAHPGMKNEYFNTIGNTYASCSICAIDISVTHGGRNDITKHVGVKQMARASSSSRSVSTFFQPTISQGVIEAETRWALFIAKHNLAFLNSDHATKLFSRIFKDSEIAKKFSCARTKCAAIATEALAPYF